MRFRQIVSVVLLLGVVAMLFPAAGEAAVLDGDGPGGLLTRVLERLAQGIQGVVSAVVEFVAAAGASPSSNG